MRRVLIDHTPPVSGGNQKKRSPGDLRRDQQRAEARSRSTVQAQIDATYQARAEAWASGEGRDPFLVYRQDGDITPNRGALAYEHPEVPDSLKGLHVEKRAAIVRESRS